MSLTVRPAALIAQSTDPLLASHPSWQRKELGEVSDVVNGFAFSSKRFTRDDGTPLVRIRDLASSTTSVNYSGDDYRSQYIVHNGDLLVGMDGDFNVARWRGADALLNQRVCKIVPNPDELDTDFLTLVLPAYLRTIHDATSSTTVKHLSSKDIAAIPIPVPTLSEQRRIVAKAAAIDCSRSEAGARVDVAQRALADFRRAVLYSACSGRLTASWRDDHPDLKPVALEGVSHAEPLLAVADLWRWARLGDISDIRSGIQVGAKRRPGDALQELPYLRVANVQRGWLDLREIKTIAVPVRRVPDLLLAPGDVLFTEGGDRDKLGRGWIWEAQLSECVHQNHVFRARLRLSGAEPKFYSWYGNSIASSYFLSQGKQTVNLASLSMNRLADLPVPVPPPAEQREIVRRVEALLGFADSVSGRLSAATGLIEKTFEAVLAQGLRGEFAEPVMAIA